MAEAAEPSSTLKSEGIPVAAQSSTMSCVVSRVSNNTLQSDLGAPDAVDVDKEVARSNVSGGDPEDIQSPESFVPKQPKRRSALLSAEEMKKLEARHSMVASKAVVTSGGGWCTSGQTPGVVSENQILEGCTKSGAWRVMAKVPNARKEDKHNLRGYDYRPSALSHSVLTDWKVGAINSKGTKGQRDSSVGQDNYSVSRLASGWEIFCVMDGHGTDGHWPAGRSIQTMPYFLQTDECSALLDSGDIEAALVYAFRGVETDIQRKSMEEGIDVAICGTTATVALRHPELFPSTIWLAHVGDSRAVLYVPGTGTVLTTNDHKPDLPEEMERLERLGCDVKSNNHPNGFVETRIYLKGKDYPGLSMSRSLGDGVVKGAGVTWEPEIQQWSLKEHPGALLLMASDGLWEFVNNEEAANFLSKALSEGQDHQTIVWNLLRLSRSLWLENEGPNYCDDITLLLFKADAVPAALSGTTVIETGDGAGIGVSCNSCTVS